MGLGAPPQHLEYPHTHTYTLPRFTFSPPLGLQHPRFEWVKAKGSRLGKNQREPRPRRPGIREFPKRPAGGELGALPGSRRAGGARDLSHLLITLISGDDLAAGAARLPLLCGVGRLRVHL